MKRSQHFDDMLLERGIDIRWVETTLQEPGKVEDQNDGTRHYLKQIPEHGNRWLRVVMNIQEMPNKAVTAFFDRRLRRKK